MIKPRFQSGSLPEIMIAFALSLLVAVSYWPVGDYGYINYDDQLYVTHNAHLKIAAFFRWPCFSIPAIPG